MNGLLRSASLSFAVAKGALKLFRISELSRQAARSTSVSPRLFIASVLPILVANQDSDYNKTRKSVNGRFAIKLPQARPLRCLFLESGTK
jgi:hypothetical protein